MQLVFATYRSFVGTEVVEVPDFIVITGRNGSGKTQLLEGIRDRALHVTRDGVLVNPNSIRFIGASELSAPIALDPMRTAEEVVSTFRNSVLAFIQQRKDLTYRSSPMDPDSLRLELVESGLITDAALSAAEEAAGRAVFDWIADDLIHLTYRHVARQDPFALEVGILFESYATLRQQNRFLRWEAKEYGVPNTWLTEAEFESRHGPAPWELLSSALQRIGLPYHFEAPQVGTGIRPSAAMRDEDADRYVTFGELSSGESALLKLAMSFYNLSDVTAKLPDLFLLDEPDSSLHPQMVASLLDLLAQQFVADRGRMVIMTTHSPTTVALAPENSVYVMHRTGHRLKQAVGRDEALSELLVGVPVLSVNYEHRRVVATESHIDADRYTRALVAVRSLVDSPYSLQFIAAGGQKSTNGCDIVIDLVSTLRDNGNQAVWGLIDRDERTEEPTAGVLMDESRNAIENLILDPLALGLLLLRDLDQGLTAAANGRRYLDIDPASDGQAIIDEVVSRVSIAATPLVDVAYAGGFSLRVPERWLNEDGHVLEAAVVDAFTSLLPYSRRSPSTLLTIILDQVWADRPSVVPASFIDLIGRLSA